MLFFFLISSEKLDFLKSGSMVTGLSKAWIGINNAATELPFGGISLKTETITKTFNHDVYYSVRYYDGSYAFPYIFTGDSQKTIIYFTVELSNLDLSYDNGNDAKLIVSVNGTNHTNIFEVYEYQTAQSAQSYYAQGAIDYMSYATYGSGSAVYPGIYDDNCKITFYAGAIYLSTNNYKVTVNSGTLTYTYYYI